MAFGAYTEVNFGSSASPQTFSSPTVSGTDTHGYLAVMDNDGFPLTTPTWNGVSMSLVTTVANFDGFNTNLKVYELDAPTTGLISLSWTGGNWFMQAMAVYFTGVTGHRTPGSNVSSAANASVSVTTVSGDEVLGFMMINSGTEPTAGTGMTLRGSVLIASDGYAGACGTESAAGTSTTVDFTSVAAGRAIWAAGLIPAAGGSSSPRTPAILTLTGPSPVIMGQNQASPVLFTR